MPKRELVAVEFRPASPKGSLISEARMRTRRSGQGGGGDYDHESETTAHPNVKHAVAHLAKLMGGDAKPED